MTEIARNQQCAVRSTLKARLGDILELASKSWLEKNSSSRLGVMFCPQIVSFL